MRTLVAALYRSIRLAVFQSARHIRVSLRRMPTIRLTPPLTLLQQLDRMSALTLVKKRFYANARIRLKADTKFERIATAGMLAKQSEFMRKLIEDNKEKIRNEINEKYKQQHNNQV